MTKEDRDYLNDVSACKDQGVADEARKAIAAEVRRLRLIAERDAQAAEQEAQPAR